MKIKRILVSLVAAALLMTGCGNNGGETTTGTGTTSGAASTETTANASAQTGANPVIKVGDEFIAEDVFAFYANMQANLYKSAYGDEVLEQSFNGEKLTDIIKANIVDSFSRDLTVVAMLKKEGFAPDEENVNKKFEDFKSMTTEETYNMYKELGATDELLKEDIRRVLYVDEYLTRLQAEVEASDEYKERLSTEIVEVKARHILVETEEEAASILEQAKSGEKSFSDLAAEFSTDEMSKINGGDLGYFGRNVMIPVFEDAAFALSPGEISEVVPSTFGYHIILCEDVRTVEKMIADGADEASIESAKTAITQSLAQRIYTEKIDAEMKNYALDVNKEYIDGFVFK